MKVLIVVPDLSMPGGVASYYSALKGHLGLTARFFTVGTRNGEKGVVASLSRILKDTLRYYRILKNGGIDFVHLNPSMHDKSVLRDGVLLLLTYLRGVKSIVFFRGWVDETERRIKRHFLSLFRWAYFKADAIVVLGEEFKLKLREMGYAGPIYVETTVAPEDAFYQTKESGLSRPETNELSGFHILFLSRMDRDKGAEETLEAFRLLQTSCYAAN